MRKLIYAINLTLDGCCDHTKGIADEELHDFHRDLIKESDTFLYGRKTYELMFPYWPDVARNPTGKRSTDDFAKAFNSVKKVVVFSKTLEKAEDPRVKIFRSNLREEVIKLKQENGKNIGAGGVDIPSQLMQLDLIDEYVFVVQPRIAGDEARLLKGVVLPATLDLKLTDSRFMKSGSVALRYTRR